MASQWASIDVRINLVFKKVRYHSDRVRKQSLTLVDAAQIADMSIVGLNQ